MKIRVKSIQEIFKALDGYKINNNLFVPDCFGQIYFNPQMFELCGKEIEATKQQNGSFYTSTWTWDRNWVTVIEPEVDWTKVESGTWIYVDDRDCQKYAMRRQFLAYLPNKADGKKFLVIADGLNMKSEYVQTISFKYAWLIK